MTVEWDDLCRDVTRQMLDHTARFATPISIDLGDHGEHWGTGAYIALQDERLLISNEHVLEKRREKRITHKFKGQEDIYAITGDHAAWRWPFDTAAVAVPPATWSRTRHDSQPVPEDRLALAHDPAPNELLFVYGFAGQNATFAFGTMAAAGTGYLCREASLPTDDDRFNNRFHFGLDYRIDPATRVVGNRDLPLPPGLSGSLVWNTGRVEADGLGATWTPDLAKVCGLVWGWPRSSAFLVATRVEHVRSCLLAWAEPRGRVQGDGWA